MYLAEHNAAARERYRTECWLERCLFVDRVCVPDEHASFVPLGVPLPVPGADLITLSFSGLDVSVACWVRRLLKALGTFHPFYLQLLRLLRQCLNISFCKGITLAPGFSRQSTHLLCPTGAGPKYARARQWGVPVVDMGWLAAMAQTGAVPAVEAFLVSPADGEDAEPVNPADANARKSSKGKEKEKIEDTLQMQDITNNYGPSIVHRRSFRASEELTRVQTAKSRLHARAHSSYHHRPPRARRSGSRAPCWASDSRAAR